MEKAYIEKIIDDYSYKVRIPQLYQTSQSFNGISIDDLPTAIVCTQPGCLPAYSVGDIVLVEFENNIIQKPIIVGQLYCDATLISSSQLQLTNKIILPFEQKTVDYENRLQLIEARLKKLEDKSEAST